MRVLTTNFNPKETAARIYCFATINEAWSFRLDYGAEVWLELKKRIRAGMKERGAFYKNFEMSISDLTLVIWRVK